MKKFKQTILIVDDEQPTIDSLDMLLGEDFELIIAKNGEEAIACLPVNSIDLVFLDINLPGIDGFETLREIKRFDENLEVVMLTADEKAKTAMKAVELGAFHYITKPYDKDDILLVTRRIFEKRSMAEEIQSLRDDVQEKEFFHNMIGQSEPVVQVYKLIEKVAQTDSTVLITGESGTGKELVAKAIHLQSARGRRHFKAINCGAIPEYLLESELFGHEKGAFTGASARKIGKFEMADGGTLFLDEIAAMPETLQVKLLRVLQEREIERVGGSRMIPVDVRVIAATNANMKQNLGNGRFREDLYYRLNVIHLPLPPLRERKGDVQILAEYFLQVFSKKFKKNIQGFTQDALACLENYGWPGNVRELRNVIERAAVLTEENFIEKNHLPLDLSIPQEIPLPLNSVFSLKEVMDVYEKKIILNILERFSWNQTKAAQVLGIHRNTLLMKLETFAINVKELKQGDPEKALA